MRTTLRRLEAIKDLIQESVDKGVTSVEQVHKAIADLPFVAMERSGVAQAQTEKPRELVGQSIGAVYEAIRRANQEVGQLVTGLFESLEDHADVQSTLKRKELTETFELPAAAEPKARRAGRRRKS